MCFNGAMGGKVRYVFRRHLFLLIVGHWITVVIAEHVVAAQVFVRLLDPQGEIVGIRRRAFGRLLALWRLPEGDPPNG
jgi:hypothetical protein